MKSFFLTFKWYRVIPMFLILILGLISFGFTYAPSFLLTPLYPLHYVEEISDSSTRHSVDPFLVTAVISCESGWDEDAQSALGAQGLMQLMPDTVKDIQDMGLVDSKKYPAENFEDPAVNIEYGCAYLRYLLNYFSGNTDRAIAAYNAGLGNVDEWIDDGGVLHNAITYPETQAYLIRVNNAHIRYQELYGNRF